MKTRFWEGFPRHNRPDAIGSLHDYERHSGGFRTRVRPRLANGGPVEYGPASASVTNFVDVPLLVSEGRDPTRAWIVRLAAVPLLSCARLQQHRLQQQKVSKTHAFRQVGRVGVGFGARANGCPVRSATCSVRLACASSRCERRGTRAPARGGGDGPGDRVGNADRASGPSDPARRVSGTDGSVPDGSGQGAGAVGPQGR